MKTVPIERVVGRRIAGLLISERRLIDGLNLWLGFVQLEDGLIFSIIDWGNTRFDGAHVYVAENASHLLPFKPGWPWEPTYVDAVAYPTEHFPYPAVITSAGPLFTYGASAFGDNMDPDLINPEDLLAYDPSCDC